MSWIRKINYDQADSSLKRVYKRVAGPNNKVDNVLSIHSLRPHTLVGHMTLYKSVLHNKNNTLPKWYLEALGVYASYLNKCDYCVQHHFSGLKRLLDDDKVSNDFLKSIKEDDIIETFGEKYLTGFEYCKVLTLDHSSLNEGNILKLRDSGFTDGEILEINQVVSYFNYVNRSVVGLGVDLKGDILGLSPGDSENPNEWKHS
jgi:uncharacterized peroxidase-related enzyme